jgi:hypothetical protein
MPASVFSGASLTTPKRRAGVASLTIDGEVFDITESSYDPNYFTREELAGQNAPHGYSEKPKYGRITATVRDAGNMTVASFLLKSNSTLALLLASGKTVQGDNMSCLECSPVNTMEATFEVVFIGRVRENAV